MPMPQQKPSRKNAFEEADAILKDNGGFGYIRPLTASEKVGNAIMSGRMPDAGHVVDAGRDAVRAGKSILGGLLSPPKDESPKLDKMGRYRDANGMIRRTRPEPLK